MKRFGTGWWGHRWFSFSFCLSVLSEFSIMCRWKVCEALGKNSLVHLLPFVMAGGLCGLSQWIRWYELSSFLLEANLGWEGGSRALTTHLLSAKLLTNLNVGKACLCCTLNLPYIKSGLFCEAISLFSKYPKLWVVFYFLCEEEVRRRKAFFGA